MKLKLKGSEAAAGVGTGNGSNVGSATLVRVYNSDTAAHLVTLETSGAATIGTFTLASGASEFVVKDPTDEIFAANAAVLLVGVAYIS